jgi:flagellar export protein FliJ
MRRHGLQRQPASARRRFAPIRRTDAMARFVFRAQAALDLRRRQEEQALRELAQANVRAAEARDALDREVAVLDAAMRRGREEEARGAGLAVRVWYRNWIDAEQQRIERCRCVLRGREAEVRAATERAQLARRKTRSLERFRVRAHQRHARGELRVEQRSLDDLGTVRYALARARAGGQQ